MTGAQQHKDMRNELQQTELESCTVHLSVHLSVYPSLSLSLSLSMCVCTLDQIIVCPLER